MLNTDLAFLLVLHLFTSISQANFDNFDLEKFKFLYLLIALIKPTVNALDDPRPLPDDGISADVDFYSLLILKYFKVSLIISCFI